MLILGAQVLFGFQFQAFLQPGFDRLPPELQGMKMVGLGLMLVAVGLLISPGAFHQIVERGNDSPRVVAFTNWIATFALLPFAVGMGLDVYLAAWVVLGSTAALPAGLAATTCPVAMWYGIEWLVPSPHRGPHRPSEDKTIASRRAHLSTQIEQDLREAPVSAPLAPGPARLQ